MNSSCLDKKIDKPFIKELSRFLLTGGSAVMTDFVGYYLLQYLMDLNIAKGCSFILGSVVAYVLNNYWTFKVSSINHVNVSQFVFLYAFSLCCNIYLNNLVLTLFESVLLAFMVATSVSTVINYIGQKFWIFKK
jgi:putative flippase GtrA